MSIQQGRAYVRALPKPIPFEMGLQVARRIRAQAAAQSNLRADAPSTGADFPRAGEAERVPDCRRAPHADHVHMCIAIPPKHPVASVVGFLKGKSAIAIARLCGKERNFTGEQFWARGYAVSTVGFELEQVR